jgi:thioredoxin-related protein
MHNQKIVQIFMLFILIGVLGKPMAFAGSKAGGINWLKYDAALDLAQKSKKHIIVDFTTSWCGWCKKMAATTYQDTQVVNTINRDFVPAMIDGDSYNVLKLKDGDVTEKGITVQYRVTGYPTTWFLEPDGTKIAPAPGYIEARSMMYILDFVRTNANDKMSFKEFVEKQKLSAGSK